MEAARRGGVPRGETLTGAAGRELAEETGHVRTEAELGPVVATCTGGGRPASCGAGAAALAELGD
jgi:hypothetical protein